MGLMRGVLCRIIYFPNSPLFNCTISNCLNWPIPNVHYPVVTYLIKIRLELRAYSTLLVLHPFDSNSYYLRVLGSNKVIFERISYERDRRPLYIVHFPIPLSKCSLCNCTISNFPLSKYRIVQLSDFIIN